MLQFPATAVTAAATAAVTSLAPPAASTSQVKVFGGGVNNQAASTWPG